MDYRIILIDTEEQSALVCTLLEHSPYTLVSTPQYTVVAQHPKTIFVYTNAHFLPLCLLQNSVRKFLAAPPEALRAAYGSDLQGELIHINAYLQELQQSHYILAVKAALQQAGEISDPLSQAATVAHIISYYVILAHKHWHKERHKSLLPASGASELGNMDRKRQCYLTYCNILNRLLLTSGPCPFLELTQRATQHMTALYPHSQIPMTATQACVAMITLGILICEPSSSLVQIPDMLPP